MKRVIICTIISLCITYCLHAQVSGTRWKTTIVTDGPLNVIFDFRKDTCSIYTVADSTLIETMLYSIQDSTITLHKIEGQSDCEASTPGVYKFILANDTLVFHMAKDDCNDRTTVLDNSSWHPWVIPEEVKLDEAVLKQYAGTYQVDETHPIYITCSEGRLWAEGPNNGLPKVPLLAENPTRFFVRIAGIHWDFIKDASGAVTGVISHEVQDYLLKKVK